MLFVTSLVFIFLTRLCFPSKLSIAEVLRKRYGDRILKLVRNFEKTDIKYKKALLDLQFLKILKIIMSSLGSCFKVANATLHNSLTSKKCQ